MTFAGTGTGTIAVTVNGGTITYPTTGSNACTGATGDGTASVTIVGTCPLNLTDNAAVATLSVTPGASTFAGWTVSLGACTGTANPCSVGPLGGGQNNLTATFNANVAPVVTPAAAQSTNEGASTSFSLGSYTDSGPSPWIVTVNWGDGSPNTTFSVSAAGTIPAQTHTYPDGPATHTVTVSVRDTNGAGLTGQATFQVTVNNVAPTVTFTSGDTTVNESGVTLHTYMFTVSDPGDDTVIGNGTTCGVGGTQVGPTTPGFLPPPSHPMGTTLQLRLPLRRRSQRPGRPGQRHRLRQRDRAIYDLRRSRQQRRPDGGPRQRRPDQRGRLGHGQLQQPVRPEPGRHDGRLPLRLQLHQRQPGRRDLCRLRTASSTSCTFNTPGTHTVRVRIIDKDGGFTEYTSDVEVGDDTPTITVTKTAEPPSVSEPSANVVFTIVVTNTSSVTDPVTILTLTDSAFGLLDDQGDCDISPIPVVLAAGASYECAFMGVVTGDGPTTHSNTVTATAGDDDPGGTDATDDATSTVQINNVAPTADIANNGPVNEGSSFTIGYRTRATPARPTPPPASATPSPSTAPRSPPPPTPTALPPPRSRSASTTASAATR